MKVNKYLLLYTAFLMSISASSNAQFSFSDQKISGVKDIGVSIYPLPTDGILHISFNKTITESPVFLVYDMIGNVVENISVDRESPSSFLINITGKKAGFYFIKIQTNTESFSRRITVRP